MTAKLHILIVGAARFQQNVKRCLKAKRLRHTCRPQLDLAVMLEAPPALAVIDADTALADSMAAALHLLDAMPGTSLVIVTSSPSAMRFTHPHIVMTTPRRLRVTLKEALRRVDGRSTGLPQGKLALGFLPKTIPFGQCVAFPFISEREITRLMRFLTALEPGAGILLAGTRTQIEMLVRHALKEDLDLESLHRRSRIAICLAQKPSSFVSDIARTAKRMVTRGLSPLRCVVFTSAGSARDGRAGVQGLTKGLAGLPVVMLYLIDSKNMTPSELLPSLLGTNELVAYGARLFGVL